MLRSQRRHSIALTLALAGLPGAAWVAGCVLSVDGQGGQACQVSDDCAQDADPCTVIGCAANGLCESTPLPDGLAPLQAPGDCKLVRCVGGRAEVELAPSDVDDGNSCTVDACDADVPTHEPLPDGSDCFVNALAGSCLAGACSVPCNQGEICDDGLPCTADSCDDTTKLCVFEPITGPVAGLEDTTGDCLRPVCAAGLESVAPDDADLPDDGKPCTTDTCVAGAPTFTPLPSGSTTAGCVGGVCNATGDCVGCVVASDCGQPAACAVPACTNEVCDPGYLPPSTNLADPTPMDCKRLACTGSAPAPVVVVSATDLPVDGNPCTSDVCTGDTPSNPITVGAACPTGVCNTLGQCVQCYLDTHCGSCESCNTTTSTCQPVAEADPGQCAAGQACYGGACKRVLGQPCTMPSQCGSNQCTDGVCCNGLCGGPCEACVMAQTGQPNGTCAPVTPAGSQGGCTSPEVCCVNGSCGSATNPTCVP